SNRCERPATVSAVTRSTAAMGIDASHIERGTSVRIATISPMINPLSQPYAGGTEAMTAQLAMGLAGRGHQVTVFATEGSEVDGARVETLGVDSSVLRWPDRPD